MPMQILHGFRDQTRPCRGFRGGEDCGGVVSFSSAAMLSPRGILLQWLSSSNSRTQQRKAFSKAMHFASDTACRGREIRESPKCTRLLDSLESNPKHSQERIFFDVGAMALLPSLLVIFSCSRASWGSNSVWRLMRSAHFLFGGY